MQFRYLNADLLDKCFWVILSFSTAGKRVEEALNESLENQSVASSQGSFDTQSIPTDDIESTDGIYDYQLILFFQAIKKIDHFKIYSHFLRVELK